MANKWTNTSVSVGILGLSLDFGIGSRSKCPHSNSEGIKTNVTLVFSQNQVLIAAKAGATYISPFIGRLMDNGQNEIETLKEMMEILNAYEFKSKLLVASVRNTRDVIDVVKMGALVAIIPFTVLEKMFKHPNTDKGLETFLRDWERFQTQLKNK